MDRGVNCLTASNDGGKRFTFPIALATKGGSVGLRRLKGHDGHVCSMAMTERGGPAVPWAGRLMGWGLVGWGFAACSSGGALCFSVRSTIPSCEYVYEGFWYRGVQYP